MTTREQGTQTTVEGFHPKYQNKGVQANTDNEESGKVSGKVKKMSGVRNKRKRLSIHLVVDEEGSPARKQRKNTYMLHVREDCST